MANKKESNPWMNYNPTSTCILKEDLEQVDKINSEIANDKSISNKEEYQIHTDIFPEPFWGNLEKANVYILCGNPGYSKTVEKFKKDERLKQYIIKNLTQDEPSLIWLEENESKQIKDEDGNPHPGYKWWLDATKDLRKYAGSEKSLDICVIEYFPYSSKKMYPAIKGKNASISNDFVDKWIKDAMDKNKWIVIVRCKTQWLKRIRRLKNYEKLLVGSSQKVYLTRNNLKKLICLETKKKKYDIPSWNDFLDACCK